MLAAAGMLSAAPPRSSLVGTAPQREPNAAVRRPREDSMRMVSHIRATGILAAVAMAMSTAPAPAADFYAGKTIDFIIGSNPGGGYDI